MVVRERLNALFFLYIYNNTRGEPSARIARLVLFLSRYFFGILTVKPIKPPGAVFGVQGSPCPSESPRTFAASAANW